MNAPLSRTQLSMSRRAPIGSRGRPERDCGEGGPAARDARAWQNAVVLAFMIAPGLGCLVFDVVLFVGFSVAENGTVEWAAVVFAPVVIAIFGAYPIAAVFGVPAYLLVRDLRVDLTGAAFTGSLVAAAPFLVAMLLSGTVALDANEVQFGVALVASGAAAGAAFWTLTFRRWGSRPRAAALAQAAEPPSPEPWRLSS